MGHRLARLPAPPCAAFLGCRWRAVPARASLGQRGGAERPGHLAQRTRSGVWHPPGSAACLPRGCCSSPVREPPTRAHRSASFLAKLVGGEAPTHATQEPRAGPAASPPLPSCVTPAVAPTSLCLIPVKEHSSRACPAPGTVPHAGAYVVSWVVPTPEWRQKMGQGPTKISKLSVFTGDTCCGKRERDSGWGWRGGLGLPPSDTARPGFAEKVVSGQELETRSAAGIWGRVFQAEGTASAKAQGQEGAWWASLMRC